MLIKWQHRHPPRPLMGPINNFAHGVEMDDFYESTDHLYAANVGLAVLAESNKLKLTRLGEAIRAKYGQGVDYIQEIRNMGGIHAAISTMRIELITIGAFCDIAECPCHLVK